MIQIQILEVVSTFKDMELQSQ
uniref:Uncharacterized protein n=1 Tax=Arundo donax TaxID=35708 RepID=A0A0A9ABQ7_ARUDO